ncbi:MAG: flagellar protein FliL [Pseudomonadota bacterium]
MATEPAPEKAEEAAPKKGKKKLFILIGVAVLVLGLAGGGAAFWMAQKKKAEREAEELVEDADAKPAKSSKKDAKSVPVFVPLDPFTVNLADREADRYAQIGISLEVADTKAGDQVKAYMPVIRNNILMVLAHKTSAEMLERDGKTRLAAEVLRETLRGLGVEPPATPASGAEGKKRKAPKEDEEKPPVTAVHFSTFIIQ